MPNSIDINLGRDNNPMESLSFYWMAEFNNGIVLQFEDGIEHKFKEVQDRINELEFFHLHHKEKDLRFIVDLKRGFIKFNDVEEPKELEKKENIRLIFFRRHRVTLTEAGKEVSHIITYHLGLQWNDNLGNNQKIILKIDEQGNFIITNN
jgi:hypothetical protein